MLGNHNFGIEQLPQSENVTVNIASPTGNPTLTITAGTITDVIANAVSGTDPEDGVMGNVNKIVITTLPLNGTMSYNGALVTMNQEITGFNPSLLSFTGIPNSETSTSFGYAFKDAASLADPTPAVYTINWGTTLPVDFMNVTGVCDEKGHVALRWEVANEVQVSHYVAEQSLDGRIFRSVGLLQATEPVAGVKEYNIVDKDAAASNFYRIRQVDRDGKYAYSKTITVNCESGRLQVQLYPNPAAHKITFEYQNAQEGQLDISNLSDAVYYFHYRLPGTNSTEAIKFTKTVK